MANVRTALLRRLAPVLLLTALLALPLHAETVAATPAADAPAAAQVVESYGSAPKGAALEGTAIGGAAGMTCVVRMARCPQTFDVKPTCAYGTPAR